MNQQQSIPSYVTTKTAIAIGENVKSLPLVLPTNRVYDTKLNCVVKLPNGSFVNPHTGNIEQDAKWSNKVYIVKEGVAFLQSLSVDKKLTTVSTVGPARTGKSYILSMLLDDKNAFELGHTMDACTYGIWVGTKTLEMESSAATSIGASASTRTVVVFDTEGLDAFSGTREVDDRIFLLSIFLSSFLIYNSLGVPKSEDLNKMQYIANLATKLRIDKEEQTDEDELRKHTPDFLWLLRDAHLMPVVDGNLVTPTEFLFKKVLATPKASHSTESTVKRNVNKALIGFFKSIECDTLPPPTANTGLLQHIEDTEDVDLSPEFVEKRKQLLAKVKSRLMPKTFYVGKEANGVERAPIPATGKTITTLLAEFINQINSGVPSLLSTSETVEQTTATVAISNGVIEYNKQMTSRIAEYKASHNQSPLEHTELLSIHIDVMKAVMESLKNEIFYPTIDSLHKHFETFASLITGSQRNSSQQHQGNVSTEQKVSQILGATKLEQVEGGELLKFLHQNTQASTNFCTKLIQDLYRPLKTKLNDPQVYSHTQFISDVEKLEVEYHQKSRGPEKLVVFRKFIDTTVESDKHHIRLLSGFTTLLQEQQEAILRQEAKILEDKSRNEMRELELKVQQEQQQQFLKQVQEDHERHFSLFKEQAEARQESELRRLQTFMDAGFKRRAEEQKQLISTLQQQLEATRMMMQQQQASTMTAIASVADAIKRIPPPVVHVSGGGGGGGGCFTEDSLVKTSTGFVKVSSLQVGDQVESLNIKTGEIEMSSIYLINEHPETFSVRYISYWNDKTGEENTLKLTDDHLVYIQQRHPAAVNKKQLVEAKNVMVQDMIYVLEGAAGKREEMKKCKVLKVEQQEATRVFGIMTMNDTLIVNGVLCSCFTMNEMWGKLDNIVPKALFSIHPSIVKTQAFKKFVALYDSIVEANFGRIWTFVRG